MSDQSEQPANQPAPPPSLLMASPTRTDRWAHRRAEPRPFAFLWILFLLASSAATVGAVGMLGLQPADVYRPTVRLFLSLAGAGVIILWPMIRLCQATPRAPRSACLQDALVVLVPLQAAIWPQAWRWMAGWSIEVVGVLALVMGGWVLLVTAMLTLALRDLGAHEPSIDDRTRVVPQRRAAWMGGFLFLASAGPLLSFALAMGLPPGTNAISVPLLASPTTAVLEIARDRSWTGHPTAVMREHWFAAILTPGLGLAALLIIGPIARAKVSTRID